jgi:hypothetical protein
MRAADEALIDIVELCLDSVVEKRRIIVRLESNFESRKHTTTRAAVKNKKHAAITEYCTTLS